VPIFSASVTLAAQTSGQGAPKLNISQIVEALKAERDRLDTAIAALGGVAPRRGRLRAASSTTPAGTRRGGRRHIERCDPETPRSDDEETVGGTQEAGENQPVAVQVDLIPGLGGREDDCGRQFF